MIHIRESLSHCHGPSFVVEELESIAKLQAKGGLPGSRCQPPGMSGPRGLRSTLKVFPNAVSLSLSFLISQIESSSVDVHILIYYLPTLGL